MQELGFGLTVSMVKKVAYQPAKSAGRQHLMNTYSDSASKWWCVSYKNRYNLTLRAPENLAAYRASTANREMINDFYSKLEARMDNLRIKDMPSRLWNCDETCISYVVKPNRVVAAVGKQ
jgi:hypothetical protein